MVETIQAEFQADSVISAAVLNDECEFVLSAATDVHFICCLKCVSIESFTFKG